GLDGPRPVLLDAIGFGGVGGRRDRAVPEGGPGPSAAGTIARRVCAAHVRARQCVGWAGLPGFGLRLPSADRDPGDAGPGTGPGAGTGDAAAVRRSRWRWLSAGVVEPVAGV